MSTGSRTAFQELEVLLGLSSETSFHCNKCPLHKTRGLHYVHGHGNPNSSLMIVNDFPSATDSATGIPFSGSDRATLAKGLNAIGLQIEDVYVTNLFRCRPPTTYAPTFEHIKACIGYLEDEIQKVKPSVVVLMGRITMEAVLGWTGGMAKRHGMLAPDFRFGCRIVPTYHPKVVNKEPKLMAAWLKDWYRIKSELGKDKNDFFVGDYKLIYTIDQFKEFISEMSTAPAFAFDIESTSLEFQKAKILGISFSYKAYWGRYVVLHDQTTPLLVQDPYVLQELKKLLTNNATKIAQNGKYDFKVIKSYMGYFVQKFDFDTLLSGAMVDETNPKALGLGHRARIFPDVYGYEFQVDNYFPKGEVDRQYSIIPTEILGRYSCIDADVTYRIYQHDLEVMQKENTYAFYQKYFHPMNRVLIRAEYVGVKVDTLKLTEYETQYKKRIQELENTLQTKYGSIDYGSPTQLKELFAKHQIPLTKVTEKGKPSLDKYAMQELADQDYELPKLLMEQKRLTKILSTYLQPLLEKRDIDDRIHGSFNQHVTVTGRLSSSRPNLQNIPSGDDIRSIFVPKEGYKFIIVDYAQMELRVMATYAQEQNMLRCFRTGVDIHGETTQLLFGQMGRNKEEKKYFRGVAKAVNFGIGYGRGPSNLASSLKISYEEAEKYVERFHKSYPSIKALQQRTWDDMSKNKYITNAFGRRRRIPNINSTDPEVKSSAKRQTFNSLIQGTASDITCLAAIRISNAIRELEASTGIRDIGYLVLTVHDELVFEVKDEFQQQVAQLVYTQSTAPIEEFPVPLDVDLYYNCSSWTEASGDRLWFLYF